MNLKNIFSIILLGIAGLFYFSFVEPFKASVLDPVSTQLEKIKSASEKLNEAWQAVSAELYKAASEKAKAGQPGGGTETGSTGPGSEQASAKKDEGVIDAEVVDEKK